MCAQFAEPHVTRPAPRCDSNSLGVGGGGGGGGGGGAMVMTTSKPHWRRPPRLPGRVFQAGKGTGGDPTVARCVVSAPTPAASTARGGGRGWCTGSPVPRLWPSVLFVLVLLFNAGVTPAHCAVLPKPSAPRPAVGGRQGARPGEDPLARLSQLFGIRRIPAHVVHGTPPQYMTELYDVVADTSGLTKAAGPYNASTVRSFPDRGQLRGGTCWYRLSFSCCFVWLVCLFSFALV